MESYGARLRRIRGKRSQKAFAAALGITVSSLNAYETGRRIPRDEVKRRILRLQSRELGFGDQGSRA